MPRVILPQGLYGRGLHADALDGGSVDLDTFRGQVLLVVNVASRCGFTPQYAELEQLHRHYRDRGFSVLGFPCNQFGRQEPEGEAAIRRFCADTYGVTFPMFAKICVNGPDTHPLYRVLKTQAKGLLGAERVMWNFTKFLVARDGRVVARYGSRTAPAAIEQDLECELQALRPGAC